VLILTKMGWAIFPQTHLVTLSSSKVWIEEAIWREAAALALQKSM
jgi:hypothetical protein